MNITITGLRTSAAFDPIGKQLQRTAIGIAASLAGGGGATFDPTSDFQRSNHEADKQAEDNATWLFEYRALLNSKLTTLTTALTSAYTTDMDAAMGSQDSRWGDKNAMQGITGQKDNSTPKKTLIDPGAGRTAFAYFKTYNSLVNPVGGIDPPTGTTWHGDDSISGAVAEGTSFALRYNYANNSQATAQIFGTTTFLSGSNNADSNLELDRLNVNIVDTKNNAYVAAKTANPAFASTTVGNNLENTLYKFFAKPENLDILRFGLFENVFIVGTSSLPTGSQVQGSLKLDWVQESNGAYIKICQERFAAFFHS